MKSITVQNGSTRWSDAHEAQLSIMSHINLWKVVARYLTYKERQVDGGPDDSYRTSLDRH